MLKDCIKVVLIIFRHWRDTGFYQFPEFYKITIFTTVWRQNGSKLIIRSIPPEVFCKKGVSKNFAKFIGKHLCQSLRLRPATLLKKRLWRRYFPVNFPKFLRILFLYRKPLVAASEQSLNKKSSILKRFSSVEEQTRGEIVMFNIFCKVCSFFLSGFSFTTIHESQDCMGKVRAFL